VPMPTRCHFPSLAVSVSEVSAYFRASVSKLEEFFKKNENLNGSTFIEEKRKLKRSNRLFVEGFLGGFNIVPTLNGSN
jgi:hypothetical protein